MELRDIEGLLPSDFERFIGHILCRLGYSVINIAIGEDIGIDVLAVKDDEVLGIQIKKYTNRKVNLEMIYHVYGAAAFYDCTRPIIVTLGQLTTNATDIAKKLKVEVWSKDKILELVRLSKINDLSFLNKNKSNNNDWFYSIWETHIKTLEGKRIKHSVKDSFIDITKVDNDGMTIINSNGRKRNFNIDIFRQVLAKLRNQGYITRSEINDDYQRRGSSAISAVLVTIPGVSKDNNKDITTLRWDID